MKPLHLEIKAFGPFSDTQSVDFSRFHNHSLFLIHGSTGSGKTSILDAICYALYGQTSISDRSLATLRSHHADPLTQTEITLTFSIGTSVFRVNRVPEQDRPKSRGSGVTRKVASSTLEQKIDENGSSQWKLLADRWSRVTEEIESILGFKCDQFRQVIILPQGEFRKLLNASSQERQSILAILFKTNWYRTIEETLKNKAREIKTNFDTLNNQLNLILSDCQSETFLQLSEKIAEAEEERRLLDNTITARREREVVIKQQLVDARNINSKFSELETASRECEQLELQTGKIAQLQCNIAEYEKAFDLSKTHSELVNIRLEYESLQQKLAIAQKNFINAQSEFKNAEDNFSQLPELERKYEQLRFHTEYLNSLIPKAAELSILQSHYESRISLHSECKKKLDQQRDHLEKVKNALNRLKDQVTPLQQESSQLELLQNELKSLEQIRKIFKRNADLNQEITKQEHSLHTVQQEYEQIELSIRTMQESIDQLEHLMYETRAALLAATLKSDTPCPVCGSTVHPHPASSDTNLPDDNQLQTKKKELKSLEQSRDSKKELLIKNERDLLTMKKEVALLHEQANLDNYANIEIIDNTICTQKLRIQKAENAVIKLKSTLDSIARGESALIAAENAVEKLSNDLTNAISSLSSAETSFRTAEREFPEEFRDSQYLSSQNAATVKDIQLVTTTITNLRTHLEQSGKNVASSQTHFESLQYQEHELKEKLNKRTTAFSNELKQSGFSDEASFLSFVRTREEIAEIKKQVQEFQLAHHAALDRKKRAEHECAHLQKVDITPIEADAATLQQELQTAIDKHAALSNYCSRMIDRRNDCNRLNLQIQKAESDYAVAGYCANVTSGENPMRITFERFILATLLDDVLITGSHRLSVMSRNRYTLHRARSQNDQRMAGGLDLLVFDSYTGMSRPVNTLSGGESFLAALSLALGLADVVQSYSGGIHLETLFIDEGFGSLDSEALDSAFQALAELGRDGRLVGVISHVSELKERIDTRLEIISGKNGSSIR